MFRLKNLARKGLREQGIRDAQMLQITAGNTWSYYAHI